jgi:hypothetical protein
LASFCRVSRKYSDEGKWVGLCENEWKKMMVVVTVEWGERERERERERVREKENGTKRNTKKKRMSYR